MQKINGRWVQDDEPSSEFPEDFILASVDTERDFADMTSSIVGSLNTQERGLMAKLHAKRAERLKRGSVPPVATETAEPAPQDRLSLIREAHRRRRGA